MAVPGLPIYDDPPRAAYIHIPFCRHRCGYCNFTVLAGRDDLQDALLDALEQELRRLQRPRPVQTLYIGGGTPAHLSPERLERLGTLLNDWFPVEPGGEWTCEANPCDIDSARLDVLTDIGVNRLSLGIQSFHSQKLALLERDHSPDDARRAFDLATSRLPNVSIDLMFAAPGESLDAWRSDLNEALELGCDHISIYGLTFERGTRFWSRLQKGALAKVPEETERDMYCLAIDVLEAAGYEQYEVSNFARPGRRSRHNPVYWQGYSYYAAGPGASRYVQGCRSTNHRSTTTYIRRVLAGDSPIAEQETLSPMDRARELLVCSLRMREGVSIEEFTRRTGWSPDELAGPALERMQRHGWLESSSGRVRLTRSGLLLSDSLWPELL